MYLLAISGKEDEGAYSVMDEDGEKALYLFEEEDDATRYAGLLEAEDYPEMSAGSVEEEAMQIFMAKKKAEDMREELRNIISMTRGPSAWDELIKTEADIRKKRQKAIYDQEERRRRVLEIGAICIGVAVLGGFLITLIVIAAKARGVM